jgi:hypothetical protein
MRARPARASVVAAGWAVGLVGLLAHCGNETFAVVAGAGDAAVDGGTGDDAATSSEAATETGADGAKLGFCASSQHAICFDFDGDGLAGLLPTHTPDGSDVVVDATGAASSPSSAHFTLSGQGRPAAQLLATLPANQGTVVCRFDLALTALPSGGDVLAINFDLQDAALGSSMTYLSLRPGSAYVGELGGPVNVTHAMAAPPPSSGWHTVEIRLSLPKQLAVVLIDAIEVLRYVPAVAAGRFTKLTFGAFSTDTVFSPTELRFDNVACD